MIRRSEKRINPPQRIASQAGRADVISPRGVPTKGEGDGRRTTAVDGRKGDFTAAAVATNEFGQDALSLSSTSLLGDIDVVRDWRNPC